MRKHDRDGNPVSGTKLDGSSQQVGQLQVPEKKPKRFKKNKGKERVKDKGDLSLASDQITRGADSQALFGWGALVYFALKVGLYIAWELYGHNEKAGKVISKAENYIDLIAKYAELIETVNSRLEVLEEHLNTIINDINNLKHEFREAIDEGFLTNDIADITYAQNRLQSLIPTAGFRQTPAEIEGVLLANRTEMVIVGETLLQASQRIMQRLGKYGTNGKLAGYILTMAPIITWRNTYAVLANVATHNPLVNSDVIALKLEQVQNVFDKYSTALKVNLTEILTMRRDYEFHPFKTTGSSPTDAYDNGHGIYYFDHQEQKFERTNFEYQLPSNPGITDWSGSAWEHIIRGWLVKEDTFPDPIGLGKPTFRIGFGEDKYWAQVFGSERIKKLNILFTVHVITHNNITIKDSGEGIAHLIFVINKDGELSKQGLHLVDKRAYLKDVNNDSQVPSKRGLIQRFNDHFNESLDENLKSIFEKYLPALLKLYLPNTVFHAANRNLLMKLNETITAANPWVEFTDDKIPELEKTIQVDGKPITIDEAKNKLVAYRVKQDFEKRVRKDEDSEKFGFLTSSLQETKGSLNIPVTARVRYLENEVAQLRQLLEQSTSTQEEKSTAAVNRSSTYPSGFFP